MAKFVEQGDEQIAKGDKKLKSFSFFGNKSEDALECYTKAANYYKQGQAWQQAGETFMKISQMHVKLQSNFEAAQALVDAHNAFKKCSSQDAIRALRASIDIYLEMGKFTTAAKHHKEIGELYETEGDLANACDHFNEAARYYMTEESTSSANQCLLKVASMSAELENYQRAVELYEQVANSSLDVALLKYSVKDYYLNSGLCLLAMGDIVACRRALDTYMDKDINFPDSPECKLLTNLVQAVEDQDAEAYTTHVAEYDSMKKLDKWKTSILLKVKRAIKSADIL